MKIGVWVPADDLELLRGAVEDKRTEYAAAELAARGYPGEAVWRAKREACERILNAIPGTPARLPS